MVDVDLGEDFLDGLGLVGFIIVVGVGDLLGRYLVFIIGVVYPFEFFQVDLFLME